MTYSEETLSKKELHDKRTNYKKCHTSVVPWWWSQEHVRYTSGVNAKTVEEVHSAKGGHTSYLYRDFLVHLKYVMQSILYRIYAKHILNK